MFRRYAEAEKQYWLQTKAKGRSRFIWREVLGALLIWLIVMLALALFRDQALPVSVQREVSIDLILFPLLLLWGFLNGRWKWKDFDKKYPE